MRFWFLPNGNKGTHKLRMSTRQVESNVQSMINLSTDMMLHQMKGIRNGRQDVQLLLPEKHGRVCKNAMIRWIIWNNQHFLFLFGNKCLTVVKCFSWKFIFWKIEMYFWMYIWGYTSIVESLIFLFFLYLWVGK
jgi:hypothetical protein